MNTFSVLLVAVAGAMGWQANDPFRNYADEKRDAKVDIKDDFDDDVKEVRYLNQGWSEAKSMKFYRLPQGSKLIPYPWFLALEQSGNQTPFADPANMNRY